VTHAKRGALPERSAIVFISDNSRGEENTQRSNVSATRESPFAPLPGIAWGGNVCCSHTITLKVGGA
jgi:hypothetical protein